MPETSWTEYLTVLGIFAVMIGLILLFVFPPWRSKARKEQSQSSETERSKQSRG
jgi:hypothetical protein